MDQPRFGICPSCDAAGVFTGTQEPEGIAVVCNACQGTGKVPSHYLPLFTHRRVRKDIREVFSEISPRRGFYLGHGIDYQSFLSGQMPDREGISKVI